MAKAYWLVALLALVLAVACTSAPADPTPNLDATVAARVGATLAATPQAQPAALPTDTPAPAPTAQPTPTVTPVPTATAETAPTATPAPTPVPTPIPPPTATPVPEPTATPVPLTGLRLSIEADAPSAVAGQPITFAFKVVNFGPEPAASVELHLASPYSEMSAPASVVCAGSFCNLGDLSVDASVTVEASVTVPNQLVFGERSFVVQGSVSDLSGQSSSASSDTVPVYLAEDITESLVWTLDEIAATHVAVGEEIYLVSGDTVYAVSKANAELLWRHRSTCGVGYSKSIALAENSLYIAGLYPAVCIYSLDTGNGELNWKFEDDSGHDGSRNKAALSVSVHNGNLFFDSQRILYSLDTGSGDLYWKYRYICDGRVFCHRQAPVAASDRLYFYDWIYGNTSPILTSLGVSSGGLLRQYEGFTVNSGGIYGMRGYFNDWALHEESNGHRSYRSYASALDLLTGEMIWRMEISPDDHYEGAPTTSGKEVYSATSGGVYSLDAGTGMLNWQYPISAPNDWTKYATSLVSSGDNLYFLAIGHMHSVDGLTGKLNWKTPIKEEYGRAHHSYVIGDNVYVVVDGELYAIDADSGRLEWHYQGSEEFEIDYGPVLFNGNLYFTSQNVLYSLSDATGEVRWFLPGMHLPVFFEDGVFYVPYEGKLSAIRVAQ